MSGSNPYTGYQLPKPVSSQEGTAGYLPVNNACIPHAPEIPGVANRSINSSRHYPRTTRDAAGQPARVDLPLNPLERSRNGGSSIQYLPATSVASNYTIPSSAASVAGFDSQTSQAQAAGSRSIQTSQRNLDPYPNLPRSFDPRQRPNGFENQSPSTKSLLHRARDLATSASGLDALVSATEATEYASHHARPISYNNNINNTNNTVNRSRVQRSSAIATNNVHRISIPNTISTTPSIQPSYSVPSQSAPVPSATRVVQQYAPQSRASATLLPVIPPTPSEDQQRTVQNKRGGADSWDNGTNEPSGSASDGGNVLSRPGEGRQRLREETDYPVAPSPAYDPVAFERMIGLSNDHMPVETPRPYDEVSPEVAGSGRAAPNRNVVENDTQTDRIMQAQMHGIAPSLLRKTNTDSFRLDALVRATEPGQLEAWTQAIGQAPAAAPDESTTKETEPVPVAKPKRGRPRKTGEGTTPRVRKKAGEGGPSKPKVRKKKTTDPAPPDTADDTSGGPFNTLTAHLAAYAQRDKALLREKAGYATIPDLDPEDIIARQRAAAARETQRAAELRTRELAAIKKAERTAKAEAQRLALLAAAQPNSADGFGAMEIDLSGFGDVDAEIDADADYEAQRQARIAHNNRIMAALGLGEISQPVEEVEHHERQPRGRSLVKKPKRVREPKYSPDGTTADPCPSGQRQQFAYVDLPNVFRSRRLRDAFHYSGLPLVPENPRDRTPEPQDESQLEHADNRLQTQATPVPKLPPVHYSELPGDPCHQCRRKSTKPKMSCRNKDPLCLAKYCISCVARYSFPFDEYSRTFICPRCQGYCNCSACLRNSGLLNLLKLDENQAKLRQSLAAAKAAPNVQVYLEMMGAPKAPPMPIQQLHRIRFVHKEEDVVTPEIPDDVLSELMASHRKRKHFAKRGVGPKKPKKSKRAPDDPNKDRGAGDEMESTTVKLKPKRRANKKVAKSGQSAVVAVIPGETMPTSQPQPLLSDASDLSDEEGDYYDVQYGYQTGPSQEVQHSRQPANPATESDLGYAVANAWSVYGTSSGNVQ